MKKTKRVTAYLIRVKNKKYLKRMGITNEPMTIERLERVLTPPAHLTAMSVDKK